MSTHLYSIIHGHEVRIAELTRMVESGPVEYRPQYEQELNWHQWQVRVHQGHVQ